VANLETENVPVVDKEEDGVAPRSAGDIPGVIRAKTRVFCSRNPYQRGRLRNVAIEESVSGVGQAERMLSCESETAL